MSRSTWAKLLLAGLPLGLAMAGLNGSYLLPVDHEAIQYYKAPVDDAVSRLQRRIDSGEVKLKSDEDFGYLKSVLDALNVSPASQVLVFSKTSFQAPRIAPRTPRALYFNDHVMVGFVRTGDVLEFAAVDPKLGVVFYTLDQEPTAHPHFDRRDTCLQCHQSGGTLGVPGLVVRSVYPDSTGMPLFHAGTFVTDHRSPLKERWGGWYVTGNTGDQTHMGNAFVEDRNQPDRLQTDDTQNLADLHSKLDTGAYLKPFSDVVALMTLEHQTQMVNLITRVGWEARLAMHDGAAINKALGRPADEVSESMAHRINSAAEELVQYMLFSGETKLTAPIKGNAEFAREFVEAGPKDEHGRSLREFDMKTRMFRYPCSYLIYSQQFDEMPTLARDRVYRRMWEVLTGKDTSAPFAHLSGEDRKAIYEIVKSTKKGLPSYWMQ
ncbi:MAG TPA: hypothetical protein VGL72_06700 [Bryobacteraceae bacterium]